MSIIHNYLHDLIYIYLFVRRPIDELNYWNRVACTISNHPFVNDDLITRLRVTIGTLQENLPRSNLFTVYDVTDISRKNY